MSIYRKFRYRGKQAFHLAQFGFFHINPCILPPSPIVKSSISNTATYTSFSIARKFTEKNHINANQDYIAKRLELCGIRLYNDREADNNYRDTLAHIIADQIKFIIKSKYQHTNITDNIIKKVAKEAITDRFIQRAHTLMHYDKKIEFDSYTYGVWAFGAINYTKSMTTTGSAKVNPNETIYHDIFLAPGITSIAYISSPGDGILEIKLNGQKTFIKADSGINQEEVDNGKTAIIYDDTQKKATLIKKADNVTQTMIDTHYYLNDDYLKIIKNRDNQSVIIKTTDVYKYQLSETTYLLS